MPNFEKQPNNNENTEKKEMIERANLAAEKFVDFMKYLCSITPVFGEEF